MDEPMQSSVPSKLNLQQRKPKARAGAAAEISPSGSMYVDMSVIPDTRVFFPPTRPSIATASTAKASQKREGIYSYDPLLDRNPDELWRFLVSHLQNPRQAVRIEGTHTETRPRVGHGHGAKTYTVTITDFAIEIDVSKCVIPQWSRMLVLRDSRNRETAAPTVREILEEHTRSRNAFKEFRLWKFVVWEFPRVTKLLTDLVRSTGYENDVKVNFPKEDYEVAAFASNGFLRAAHSKAVRVLCFVTCLCVVFCPALAIARKRMKNPLVCMYSMAVTADEFYSRNCSAVQSAVERRCKDIFIVAL